MSSNYIKKLFHKMIEGAKIDCYEHQSKSIHKLRFNLLFALFEFGYYNLI